MTVRRPTRKQSAQCVKIQGTQPGRRSKGAGGPRVLEVIAIGDKRGPVAAALALFIDHTPEPEPLNSPLDIRERGAGRPTKRERRKLGKVRGF